jgi:hypothetical protein
MQRSDMIKNLKQYMERQLFDYFSLSDVEGILDFLEEEGMMPPYDPASDDEDPRYCWAQELKEQKDKK